MKSIQDQQTDQSNPQESQNILLTPTLRHQNPRERFDDPDGIDNLLSSNWALSESADSEHCSFSSSTFSLSREPGLPLLVEDPDLFLSEQEIIEQLFFETVFLQSVSQAQVVQANNSNGIISEDIDYMTRPISIQEEIEKKEAADALLLMHCSYRPSQQDSTTETQVLETKEAIERRVISANFAL